MSGLQTVFISDVESAESTTQSRSSYKSSQYTTERNISTYFSMPAILQDDVELTPATIPSSPNHNEVDAAPQSGPTPGYTDYLFLPLGFDVMFHRDRLAKIALESEIELQFLVKKNKVKLIADYPENLQDAREKIRNFFDNCATGISPARSRNKIAKPDRPGAWGQPRELSAIEEAEAIRQQTRR
ncbi:hypothetical protein BC832DRAFT_594656 [Gaertneriomyces semiglobifer]|nr:hypothetical protein BC832DRAFT_594656 [Gaertneriomyces semiglobifer]